MADDSSEIVRDMVRGGARATRIIADDLLGAAVENAPIDEGTLRASGHVVYVVNDVEFHGGQYAEAVAMAVELAATGALTAFYAEVRFSTEYAAAQHEGIALMHRAGHSWLWQARNYPKGGGPKYLERPFDERASRYEAALAASIRPQLAGD